MKRKLQLGVGLALLGAACAPDVTRTAPVVSAEDAVSGHFTHPAGTINTTTPLGGRPFGLAVSSEDVVYVTLADEGRVQRFDLPSFTPGPSVAVGSIPTGVAFRRNAKTAWVTNQFSNTVSVIDVATDQQIRTIPVDHHPVVVIAGPDGETVYVSDNVGDVFAFDVETDRLVATMTFSSLVNGFVLHPDGQLLYASQVFNGTVSEINTQTNTVARNFPIGGSTLQGVAVSRDGDELYVADEGSDVLRVVDIASGAEIATVPLGGGGFGVALSPDNAQVYVSLSQGGPGCQSGGCVKVVDRASRAVVNTIETHGTPRRLGFSVIGETAVIANENGWVDFVR